jgi:hypothetical protein
MTPIMRSTLVVAVVGGALAGCIRDPQPVSLKDTPDHAPARTAAATSTTEKAAATAAPALKATVAAPDPNKPAAAPPAADVTTTAIVEEKKTADDDLRRFCDQRFIDYQAGKRPGGAATLAQKQADDRMCEALRKE